MELNKSDDFFEEVENDQKPFYYTLLRTVLKRNYKDDEVLSFEEIKKLIPIVKEHDEIHVYFSALIMQIVDHIVKIGIDTDNIDVILKYYFYKNKPVENNKLKLILSNDDNQNYITYSNSEIVVHIKKLLAQTANEQIIYIYITNLLEKFDEAASDLLAKQQNIYQIEALQQLMVNLCHKATKQLTFIDYKKIISKKILKKAVKNVALGELKNLGMQISVGDDSEEKSKNNPIYHQSLFENTKLCVDGLVLNNQQLLNNYKILKNLYTDDGQRKSIYNLINDKKQAKIDLRRQEQTYEKILIKDITSPKKLTEIKNVKNNLLAIDYFYSQLIFSELKYLYHNRQKEFINFLNDVSIYPIKVIEDMSNYFIEHNNIEINSIYKYFTNKSINFEEWNNYSRYLSSETSDMQQFMAVCQRYIVAKHFV